MMHYYCIVGQTLCESGFMGKGRRYLFYSHRVSSALYPLVLLILSIPGGKVYNRMFLTIKHTPLSLRFERLLERMG